MSQWCSWQLTEEDCLKDLAMVVNDGDQEVAYVVAATSIYQPAGWFWLPVEIEA